MHMHWGATLRYFSSPAQSRVHYDLVTLASGRHSYPAHRQTESDMTDTITIQIPVALHLEFEIYVVLSKLMDKVDKNSMLYFHSTDYQEQVGPDPENHKGPDPSLAQHNTSSVQGPDATLIHGPDDANIHGPDPELVEGPRISVCEGLMNALCTRTSSTSL